jgi:hypothetical protein
MTVMIPMMTTAVMVAAMMTMMTELARTQDYSL